MEMETPAKRRRRTAKKKAWEPSPRMVAKLHEPPAEQEQPEIPAPEPPEPREAPQPSSRIATTPHAPRAPPEPPKPPNRIVTFPELRPLGVLLSKRQVDRLEAANLFPKRVAMSFARVGWLATEIIEYVNGRIAARSTAIGTLGSDSGPKRKRPIWLPVVKRADATKAKEEASA